MAVYYVVILSAKHTEVCDDATFFFCARIIPFFVLLFFLFATAATDDMEDKPNLVVSSRDRALFTPLKMYLRRKLIPSA